MTPRGVSACRSSCMPTNCRMAAARALAAEFGALSADHLEYTDEAGVAAMARAGVVAVLLPGAFYVLRETQAPPVELFRRHRVPMAVATDLQPGTSPLTSHSAGDEHGRDAVRPDGRGVPRRRHARGGARARARQGRPARSKRANGRIWRSGTSRRPAELVYRLGFNPLARAHLERPMTVMLRPGEATARRLARDLARRIASRSIPHAGRRSQASAAAVERIVARGEPVYGINTGFGKLASVRIDDGRSRAASAQHRAVARGGRRRADAGPRRRG